MQPSPKPFLCLLGLLSTALVVRAATLESYFDFTLYGEIGGNYEITSNVYGEAIATVKPVGTRIDGAGLTVVPGQPAGQTGVTLAGDQVASFTGDFSLQVWFVAPAVIVDNTVVFGGTTSVTIDESMAGDQALFAGYGKNNLRFFRQVVSNNTKYGANGNPPPDTGTAAGKRCDYVLTYTAATKTFQAYLDGVMAGPSLHVPYFAGLSSLEKGFSIGGVASPAFKDEAAAVKILSFRFYRGGLTSSEVAALHEVGAGAALEQLEIAGVEIANKP